MKGNFNNERIGKRRAQMSTEKLITIIIVVAVIIVAALFIFGSNINGWLKNLLPGYEYETEDKLIDINTVDATTKNILCPVVIGTLVPDRGYIVLSWLNIYVDGKKTELLWEDTSINYDRNPLKGGNIKIGEILNGAIKIDSEWIDNYAATKGSYWYGMDDLPSLDILTRLNGAYRAGGTNGICKEK